MPTVTDNLYKQGTIPTESIGIFYQPTTSTEEVANGEMTFGGTDDERCVSRASCGKGFFSCLFALQYVLGY